MHLGNRDVMVICGLGLISIVGNKFDIFDTGPSLLPSLFVGERSSTRADWDLDDLVLSRVRAAAPDINVRMINYDKEELRRSAQNRSMFGSFSADIRDFARQVASGTTCHRYLIVHRASSLISSHQADVTGIGVVNVRGPLAWVGAYLYALTEMRHSRVSLIMCTGGRKRGVRHDHCIDAGGK